MADETKLLAPGRLRIRIALGSLLVLSVGALAAPRVARTQLESAPQEHAAPLLQEQAQRREVEAPFLRLQAVAAETRQFTVAIATDRGSAVRIISDALEPAPPTPVAGYGALVSPTQVVTHASVLDGRSSVMVSPAGAALLRATVSAYEPSTGLVLLTLDGGPALAAPRIAAVDPAAGALVVAAAQDIAAPVFITSVAPDRYAMAGQSLPAGLPLYTLDGEVLAIVVNDGREPFGVPVRDAAQRMTARAAAGERRSAIGVSFQQPPAALAEVVGRGGVLITDVVAGGPADIAGLEPGDMLVAVGPATVDTIDAAASAVRALPASAPSVLRVRRNREVRSVEVIPMPSYDVAALARAAMKDAATTDAGAPARALFSEAQLASAGLAPTARVLSVNGRAVRSRRDVERESARSRSAPMVLVRQDGRQFFAVVPR